MSNPALSAQNQDWVNSITELFPHDIAKIIDKKYYSHFKSFYRELLRNGVPEYRAVVDSAFKANVWLRTEWLPLAKNASLAFAMNDDEITKMANGIISELTQISVETANNFDCLDDGIQGIEGGELSKGAIRAGNLIVIEKAMEQCDRLKIKYAKGNFEAASKRYLDTLFWIRKLRRAIYPLRENIARKAGMIGKFKSPYSTLKAQDIRTRQLARAAKWSRENFAINPSTKQPISMADIIACAENSYRARIIAKAAGLNNLKAENNLASAMITITCPGAFRVGKSDERTITECIEYMRQIDKRISAAISKDKLKIAGMQVPQPHQDGTPHQHIYVIGSKADIQFFYNIIDKKAMDIHPFEKGAAEARTKIDWEDTTKGVLSTYVLSYVLRFTTPEKEKLDITDDQKKHQEASAEKDGSAEDSYYFMNGLRRVGWFGLPADYAWEACRSATAEIIKSNPQIAKICEAAKAGNFAKFTELVGGIAIPRKDRPYKAITEDKTTKFGDTYQRYLGATIFGINVIVKGDVWELVAGLTINYPSGDESPKSRDFCDDMSELVCLWAIPEPAPD